MRSPLKTTAFSRGYTLSPLRGWEPRKKSLKKQEDRHQPDGLSLCLCVFVVTDVCRRPGPLFFKVTTTGFFPGSSSSDRNRVSRGAEIRGKVTYSTNREPAASHQDFHRLPGVSAVDAHFVGSV